MTTSILKTSHVPVKIWVPHISEVESSALDQLRNVGGLPWAFHHVAVMPDVHQGKGCTVGSVIAMQGAVSPAAVGVDIGCGMGALRTSLVASDLPDNLLSLRSNIELYVPVGFSQHTEPSIKELGAGLEYLKIKRTYDDLMLRFSGLIPRVQDLRSKAACQLGTLGGGNHFIELSLDREQRVWVVLHSGSRNIGKSLAEVHIAAARDMVHNQYLPDRDLSVFLAGTPEMAAYTRDLFWAQEYALLNRRVMFTILKRILKEFFPQATYGDPILCHHNYVSTETHFEKDVLVTRKGAISARKGELGIIPGSMGTKTYIVKGLGNPESFQSASHGAGRRMSRGAAKRSFTVEDLTKQTEGIECRKDSGMLDEIPGAYKDIDQVMANQSDLVEVVQELKQILCVKG
jgi:tRNA-splicing ligase RtcB